MKDYAFRNCPILGSITFSASLTSIGASAFENAGMVTSLSLPASLKSIGGYAFSGCTSLREVSFPTALESIGGYAFMGANLRSITLPDSLKSMSDKAFYNSGVEEIHASTNSLGHQYAELNGIRFVSTGSSVTPPSEPTEENGVKLAIPSLSMQVGTYYDLSLIHIYRSRRWEGRGDLNCLKQLGTPGASPSFARKSCLPF